jgi:hypothetical protein
MQDGKESEVKVMDLISEIERLYQKENSVVLYLPTFPSDPSKLMDRTVRRYLKHEFIIFVEPRPGERDTFIRSSVGFGNQMLVDDLTQAGKDMMANRDIVLIKRLDGSFDLLKNRHGPAPEHLTYDPTRVRMVN